jgi:hypothetical protein
LTAKIIEARNELAYQIGQLSALQRLGTPQVKTQSVPKVKREDLQSVEIYITYASAAMIRETRATIKTNPLIDVAIVAPLNEDGDERERLAEFYLDCLEQIGRESLALVLDGWFVAACEILTPADPERWRNQSMYAGILRFTVEER